MDVRCERCRAQYVFDDDQVTPGGLTVQCTNCGHVFKVKVKELVVTVPVKPGEGDDAPIPATAAAPKPPGATGAPPEGATHQAAAAAGGLPATRRQDEGMARPAGEWERLHLQGADDPAEVDRRTEGLARRRDLPLRRSVEAARQHRGAGQLLPGGRGGRDGEDARGDAGVDAAARPDRLRLSGRAGAGGLPARLPVLS